MKLKIKRIKVDSKEDENKKPEISSGKNKDKITGALNTSNVKTKDVETILFFFNWSESLKKRATPWDTSRGRIRLRRLNRAKTNSIIP